MLLTSYLAYLIGPLVYQIFVRLKNGLSFLEGFIVVAISGLSIAHLIQFIGIHNIFLIVALLSIGLFLPTIFESIFSKAQAEIHSFLNILVAAAFLIHVLLEASVLGHHDNANLSSLSSGILMHRITDGMLIWWLLRPKYGNKVAGIGITLLVLANLIGFTYSESIPIVSKYRDYLEILMSGMLLHVLIFSFHLHPKKHPVKSCCKKNNLPTTPKKNTSRGIGYLAGIISLIIFLYFTNDSHHGHHANNLIKLMHNVVGLFYMSAPALLIAFILSGIIQVFISIDTLLWFNRGNRYLQAFKGMILGLPLPICSCGILPFYQTLTKKGLAPAAGLAFLIATPELGLDALLISLPLLGPDLTIARLIAAIFLALGISLILSPMLKAAPLEITPEEIKSELKTSKLGQFWFYATKKIVDDISPLVILGILVAALFELILAHYSLANYHGWDVILAAIAGIFLYVCASGATPVVAIFLASGVSPGAAISFLMTGPATNLSTFAMLSKLHSKKFSFAFAIVAIILSLVAGMATNLIFETGGFSASKATHQHLHYSWWENLSAIIIGILFILSFLRRIDLIKKG